MGEQTKVRLMTVVVRTNTGPPTWWLPRFDVERMTRGGVHVRAGWVRGCIEVGVRIRNVATEEKP